MLGWEVLVTRKVSERTTPATADDAIGELVVRWRAQVEGLRWICELCDTGEGVDLGGDGYPYRFTVRAGGLSDVLAGGVPPHCRTVPGPTPARQTPDLQRSPGVVGQVDASEWLLLTVFDMS